MKRTLADRRTMARIAAVCAAGVLAIAAPLLAASPRPNVILCMSDDQGWGDTGYNGHPHLKTPHLDRMSREGVTFTRFYSAAAMCSPTRASCYTGRHPYRFGVTFAMTGRLEASEIPITTVLKRHGYTTGHFGKWHLGTLTKDRGDQNRWGDFANKPERYYCPPWERDVDVCFVTESKVPTWDPLVDPKQRDKAYGNDYFSGAGEIVTKNTDGDDSRVIMDRAIPFIRDAVSNKQPFFAVIWFHTPHSPVVGGPKHLDMYADQPEPARHYYACLTAMDEQIGRLRAELERLKVADDTMLWFCSDNGPARQGSPRHVGSNGGLSGYKLSIREGGIRVPGLLVWPRGVEASRTIAVPCVTSDYFPTILEVLNIPMPAGRIYDGISLLPLIQGKRQTRDTPIGFLNANGSEAAWMEDRFKLVLKRDRVQLFDIHADAAERHNLADDHPAIVDRMKASLDAWRAGVMADLNSIQP